MYQCELTSRTDCSRKELSVSPSHSGVTEVFKLSINQTVISKLTEQLLRMDLFKYLKTHCRTKLVSYPAYMHKRSIVKFIEVKGGSTVDVLWFSNYSTGVFYVLKLEVSTNAKKKFGKQTIICIIECST